MFGSPRPFLGCLGSVLTWVQGTWKLELSPTLKDTGTNAWKEQRRLLSEGRPSAGNAAACSQPPAQRGRTESEALWPGLIPAGSQALSPGSGWGSSWGAGQPVWLWNNRALPPHPGNAVPLTGRCLALETLHFPRYLLRSRPQMIPICLTQRRQCVWRGT